MKTRLLLAGILLSVPLVVGVAAETPKEKAAAKKENPGPDTAAQLAAAKADLAKLRERYLDEHPMVKVKLKQIAELERRLAEEKSKR